MRNKIDFLFLKKPLIFITIAIIFSIILVELGWQYEDAQLADYQKGASSLRATHKKYQNLVKDIDLLEQYTVKYTDYKASGLVGGERRLSWIESLRATNSVLKLPKLSFTLQPQEDFERPKLKVDRNVEVKSSPMELDMSLMHEEDVFALIDGLSSNISNLFTVDSCSMTLQGAIGKSFDTKKANLNSTCVIRWISIDAKT
jgi:hypothetical protein